MGFYGIIKRGFDIVVSLIALLILSPIFLISTIAILISDPGPIFYRAKRVGKNNKVFLMFKFRSMRVDKNADEKNFKADTNRIFGWGKFMRDMKLDELPQLINILIGDMSFVGPRPASVDQVEIVRAGKYAETSKLRPGLSSPSALYDYIYGDTIEDEAEYEKEVLPTRLDLDLYYLKAYGFFYDIKIIFQTVVCIVCSIFKKKPKKMYEQLVACAESVRTETIPVQEPTYDLGLEQ